MKTCGKCKQEKDLSEFYPDKSKSGYRWICKTCDKARIAEIQLRTKERYINYWEKSRNHKGCLYCNYSRYAGALDFHHRDPLKKDFALGRGAKRKSWETAKLEIDKCDLVCSNCHRELHGGYLPN